MVEVKGWEGGRVEVILVSPRKNPHVFSLCSSAVLLYFTVVHLETCCIQRYKAGVGKGRRYVIIRGH